MFLSCASSSDVVMCNYMSEILRYFPLTKPPRKGQVASMNFIEEMIGQGVQDVVIEAPTGAGKSSVGAAVCRWASTWPEQVSPTGVVTRKGGYYLVTQKVLQDQITHDVRDNFTDKDYASLKSSESYECDRHGNCQIGLQAKKERCCEGKKEGTCPYLTAKARFDRATFSVTNYPYFLTERMYVNQFPTRNVLILDECHTLAKQLLRFGELVISQEKLREWNIRGADVPEFDDMRHYLAWLEKKYLLVIKERAATLQLMLESDPQSCKDPKVQSTVTALQNQVQKTELAISGASTHPEDWVYWVDETEKDGRIVSLKPLVAAPYMDLVRSGGMYRVHMSAYPGDKHIYCRSLGLDPEEVAWIKLKSPFAPEHRPIIMSLVGSMSKRNKAQTFPSVIKVIDRVLTAHATEKGVLHVNSYALGTEVYDHFSKTVHGVRLRFPRCADEREQAMAQHALDSSPSVLVSPSMTEGFDFKGDLARWQCIVKIPYPYLGDQQILALKERDPDWYALQTVSTIIQTCGRIVRDFGDKGISYILDSDFLILFERHGYMFPSWFKSAMVWPGK
jgi:ATP-dependent DNA helicase DinG